MYHESLVTHVYYTTNTIASVKGSTGTWIIFHRPMIVTVFDFLEIIKIEKFFNALKWPEEISKLLKYRKFLVYLSNNTHTIAHNMPLIINN